MEKNAYLPIARVHELRYVRHKTLGLSIEEIAKEDHVKPFTVQQSVNSVAAQRAMFGIDVLEASQIEVIQSVQNLEKIALAGALQAEKRVFVETGDHAGEVLTMEPDHDTRIRAMDVVTEKTKAVMARHVKPGNNTNVNVGVGVNVTSPAINTFEDRFREVVRRRSANTQIAPPVENELPPGDVLDLAPEKAKTASVADPQEG